MSKVSIIMYHYVRELPYTRFPRIKGLLTSEFKSQLDYMAKHYKFVTMQQCLDAVYHGAELPNNAALLTFDDAYIDHFTNVFPILNDRGIQGCFFPPASVVMQHKVLDVNKIHFILAAADNLDLLIRNVYAALDEYRDLFQLDSNAYYFNKLAIANRFDPKEIIFVKRLLQRELPAGARAAIVDQLFKHYVSSDEAAFSRELYMDMDQIGCLARNGMYIGGHSFSHSWLNTLTHIDQEIEIDLTVEFLRKTGCDTNSWVMCYPYGGYNESLIEVLKSRGCVMGLTTKVGIAALSTDNAFKLERLDTVDLPVRSEEPAGKPIVILPPVEVDSYMTPAALKVVSAIRLRAE
ncbi:polysaccharide deacetylase family protein [Paenibacillus harenae]|uniref:polysaccharide deacetylase family protein n=1 Tax=Paenibacillus harenae TaxID=306543 RepID=UPI00040923C7|nr:polysaccharide deacetylase family protein [Paenibacillus harenae]